MKAALTSRHRQAASGGGELLISAAGNASSGALRRDKKLSELIRRRGLRSRAIETELTSGARLPRASVQGAGDHSRLGELPKRACDIPR